MAITNFPNGISSFGMPIIGAGGAMTTGSVFFVDSVTGSNGNSGTDPDNPFSTLDYAVGNCTANKGDIIFLMPNHAESLTAAAGVDLDVAGITVIGLGTGTDRATFTLGTTEACDVDFGADNITIHNIVFDLTGIDAVAAGIDIDAQYAHINQCEIIGADASGQATIWIDVGDSSHGFKLTNSLLVGTTDGGAADAINVNGACNEMIITDNIIYGSFSNAAVSVSAAGLRCDISRNHIGNNVDDKAPVDLGATSVVTGFYADNRIGVATSHATATTYNVGQAWAHENYTAILSFNTMSGILYPAVYSTSDERLKREVEYL
jgi:hypothetical protein